MAKEYIKNITDKKESGYSPVDLSFNENGKRTILKPGEQVETKAKGNNIDGKRLKLVTEEKEKVKSKNKGEVE